MCVYNLIILKAIFTFYFQIYTWTHLYKVYNKEN